VIIALIIIAPFVIRRLSVKTNFFIIGGFLSLLIVLSLIGLLLPSSVLVKSASPSLNAGNSERPLSIIERVITGNYAAPDGFTKTECNFEPRNSVVKLSTGNNLFTGQVFVGIKGEDVPDNGDGKIDIYSYMSTSFDVRDVNFAPETDPPVIQYNNDILTLGNATQKAKNYDWIDDSYSIGQFLSGDQSFNSGSMLTEEIYVLLPHGVSASGTGFQRLSDIERSGK
jgi:hypothetical protein